MASFPTLSSFTKFLVFFLICPKVSFSDYDSRDPNGNITIKWDVISWTADGYIAIVRIINFQKFRHIQAPGWKLSWTWARKEVIWGMNGAQTTEQGDCSSFSGNNIPYCCQQDPTIVDLLPGTPYNQQIENCCTGGILSSSVQDPENAISAFQLTVGQAGTRRNIVRVPKDFALKAPAGGYTCGSAAIVKPSRFMMPDGRRVTQALMTWNVTCTYSHFLTRVSHTCCVSLSSFYNNTIVHCPTCTCGCRNGPNQPWPRVERDSPDLASVLSSSSKKSDTPLVQCTSHMCPIRVHWHVKLNYKEYWRVKITITNFNYRANYSQWNLVVEHPNFDNLTQMFSFNYKSISPYDFMNDTAMLWGIKFYNDVLMEAGPDGYVQSELLFRKEKGKFTLHNGWAFPRKIYFNGDDCVMPPPDAYPYLPSASAPGVISMHIVTTILASLLLLLAAF